MKWLELVLVLLAGLALGSNMVIVRMGIGEFPPMTFTLLRFLITLAAFGVTLVVMRRKLPRRRRVWFDIMVAGVTNTAVPVIVFTYALQHISSGVLGVLMALYPLLTAVLAHFFFSDHERLTLVRLVGLGLALSGSLVIVMTGTTGLGAEGSPLGYVLALIGVVMGAVSVIYMRKRLADQDPIVVTGGQVLFSTPLVVPFVFTEPRIDLAAIPAVGWFALVFAALIGSFLGYLLLMVLIKRYGATSGALPGYVLPVVATLLGALLLDEVITITLIIGAAMVLTGVFLVSNIKHNAGLEKLDPQKVAASD